MEKTPLLLAIESNNPRLVRIFLDSKANPFFTNSKRESPFLKILEKHDIFEHEIKTIMSIATEELSKEQPNDKALLYSFMNSIIRKNIIWLFDYIKENFTDILKDTKIPKFKTYLNLATHYGQDYIVKELCEFKELLNIKDNRSNTALMIAILQNKVSIGLILLNYDLDLRANNQQNLNAIQLAMKNKEFYILVRTMLTKNKIEKDETFYLSDEHTDETILSYTIRNDDPKLISFIFPLYTEELRDENNFFVHQAAACDSINSLKYFAKLKLSFSTYNDLNIKPLELAAIKGSNNTRLHFIPAL